eukprot:CAMPEP_0119528014 /NCGR_PEP_ID=MMETSP1344-20130328/42300_1 /TAXON_ID=236787 /ORGANISM="Florenciella parvula, Strain CCMP2471" /LENGTH=41 /DNA_ID= /DNA_START= /DNA_END= /DNA_ORIENTATION=
MEHASPMHAKPPERERVRLGLESRGGGIMAFSATSAQSGSA